MDKSGNQFSIQPVASINPVKAIAGVGHFAQAFESREQALAKHQTSLLNSGLAKSLSAPSHLNKLSADLSPLAKFINQSLQQADTKELTGHIVARQIVITDPKQTTQFSKALGQAINQSGLFYESHLADFIDGQRPLASLKLEPQAQSQQLAYALLPQQLHVLEHQRIAWHGEVWPNQLMEWHIQLPEEQHQQGNQSIEAQAQAQAITTELALSLPKLGKVRAQLQLVDGKVSLKIHAESEYTITQLQQHSSVLSQAMALRGQSLEMVSIQPEKMLDSATHA